MSESIPHECCQAFRKACEDATDNEGYGPLVYLNNEGEIVIGYELKPLHFCPWCGSEVGQPPTAEDR